MSSKNNFNGYHHPFLIIVVGLIISFVFGCAGRAMATDFIEIVPPAPEQIDKCGTEEDGVIVPPATEGYSYVKLVDGFHGGDLTEGFNAYTGSIIVSINEGYLVPGGNETVWSFDFTDEPCEEEIPEGKIISAVVLDCQGKAESGFVEVEAAFQHDVEVAFIDNSTKGGPLFSFMLPAGQTRIDFGPAEIEVINQVLVVTPTPIFWGFLEDRTFEVGFLLTNEECVEVGEPPVPPTDPVVKALQTTAECTTFTVTNTGNIQTLTEGNDAGYHFDGSAMPPVVVLLLPGESAVIEMEIGQTIYFSAESYQVTGPTQHTAVSCEPDVTVGEPQAPSQMLPLTGPSGTTKLAIGALAASVAGLVLLLVARRPKMA